LKNIKKPIRPKFCNTFDIVYLWVNGSDSVHQEKERATRTKLHMGYGHGKSRYRDYETLKYSLRSIEKYVPWARMVYIVTDNQIPWWLNTSYPRVKVIDHKDIFEKDEYLPIFNSNGIDASLHNIPGVAPCFLYLNDDVLVGHPIQITDFYDPKTGVQRMFPSAWVAPQTDKMKSNLWHAAVGYSDKLIDAAFGSSTPHHYAAHGCHFFQLHILTEMANRWPEEYDNTKKHPFRTATDVTIPFLHQNYALHAYNAKITNDGLVNYGILTTDISANHKIYSKVAKKDRHCVCLQDGFGDDDTPEVLAAVNDLERFLESQYPGKSHFEKIIY